MSDTTPPLLSPAQYIDAVAANSARLAQAARLNLKAPVPTCPGWSVAHLVAHIGEVQYHWANHVRLRAQTEVALPDAVYDRCPGLKAWYQAAEAGRADLDAVPAGLVEWFEGATAALVAAFRHTAPEEAIYHWSGDHRGITHMRNQAMEAAIHRYDAENAVGAVTPIDPVLALDGIEQHFAVQVPASRRWGKPAPGRGETYHLHRTDGHGEWLVRFDGDTVTVRHEHEKGDVALRGSAQDLFLWLWGRIPAERLELFGDPALVARYRELVPPN